MSSEGILSSKHAVAESAPEFLLLGVNLFQLVSFPVGKIKGLDVTYANFVSLLIGSPDKGFGATRIAASEWLWSIRIVGFLMGFEVPDALEVLPTTLLSAGEESILSGCELPLGFGDFAGGAAQSNIED